MLLSLFPLQIVNYCLFEQIDGLNGGLTTIQPFVNEVEPKKVTITVLEVSDGKQPYVHAVEITVCCHEYESTPKPVIPSTCE